MVYRKSDLVIPPMVRGDELDEYFRQHVEVWSACHRGTFYRVTRPLHVFKKVLDASDQTEAIANLIVPIGAFVYCMGTEDKLRASVATVDSIVAYKRRFPSLSRMFTPQSVRSDDEIENVLDAVLVNIALAQSNYSPAFKYVVGDTVVPKAGFAFLDSHCAGGIHFFLNVRSALGYCL